MNWRTLDNARKKYFRKYKTEFTAALKSQTASFISDVKKCESTDKMIALAKDYKVDKKPIFDTLPKCWVEVGSDYAVRTKKQFQKADMTGFYESYMENFAKTEAGQRITNISETTYNEIVSTTQKMIDQGIKDGLGTNEIGKMIADDLNLTDRWRGIRIAQTEVISASNRGSLLGAESTGLNLIKIWLTAHDGRVRSSHNHMNNKEAKLDEKFSNGLKYPGDPDADASEVVNCRCTITYKEI